MPPTTQPSPIINAIRDAVGRPIQRLISWKCRYRTQSGKEILRHHAAIERAPVASTGIERIVTDRAHALPATTLRAHPPDMVAWALADANAGRRRPQVWQKRAPIMNSEPQSAQVSAISGTAGGSVASTAGASPAGDRQNSCGVSCATCAIRDVETPIPRMASRRPKPTAPKVFSSQILATSPASRAKRPQAIITHRPVKIARLPRFAAVDLFGLDPSGWIHLV